MQFAQPQDVRVALVRIVEAVVGRTLSVLEADMRDAETLTMSAKELDRWEIIGRVVERRLTQRAAAPG